MLCHAAWPQHDEARKTTVANLHQSGHPVAAWPCAKVCFWCTQSPADALDAVVADPNGHINAVSTICAHRGAPLSSGWLDTVAGQTCVRCPYHSWAFTGQGKLAHVPSEPDGRFPKRALQEPFELVAAGNLVWLWWGNPRMPASARPPVPSAAADTDTVCRPLRLPLCRTRRVLLHSALSSL